MFQCFNKTFSVKIGIAHPLPGCLVVKLNQKQNMNTGCKSWAPFDDLFARRCNFKGPYKKHDWYTKRASFEYIKSTAVATFLCVKIFQPRKSTKQSTEGVVAQICTCPSVTVHVAVTGGRGTSLMVESGGRAWLTVITPICVFSRYCAAQLVQARAISPSTHLTHRLYVLCINCKKINCNSSTSPTAKYAQSFWASDQPLETEEAATQRIVSCIPLPFILLHACKSEDKGNTMQPFQWGFDPSVHKSKPQN